MAERMLNENIIKGKWSELKGKLQGVWGNLTNDEIDYARGDLNKFYGSVQQKYGHS
ncbi:MAG: CsbD family protein [Bdellovibrionales bacterium]